VNDDGQIVAMRVFDWNAVFLEQRVERTLQIWAEPFVELQVPLLFHLRRDSFEKAQHGSNTYYDWFLQRPIVVVPMQGLAAKLPMTMKDYPPSQSPGSFNLEKIQRLIEASGSK
jgi:arylsulfatase